MENIAQSALDVTTGCLWYEPLPHSLLLSPPNPAEPRSASWDGCSAALLSKTRKVDPITSSWGLHSVVKLYELQLVHKALNGFTSALLLLYEPSGTGLLSVLRVQTSCSQSPLHLIHLTGGLWALISSTWLLLTLFIPVEAADEQARANPVFLPIPVIHHLTCDATWNHLSNCVCAVLKDHP